MTGKKKRTIILAIAAVLLALVVWTVWGNTALELNTYTVGSKELPDAFDGYRIAHVSDLHNAEMGDGNEKLLAVLREADPDIIAITGDLIDSRNTNTYVACGVDLALSGHAHGGQFRLPFVGGLVAPNQGLFPKYDSGLYTEGNTNMIVSRGIGNSILPFRFNNRPEVILIELKATPN